MGTSFGAVLSFSTTGATAAPVSMTLPVSSSDASSAVLEGTVNPNGEQAVFTFEYGTSTSFGSITPVRRAGRARSPTSP